MRKRKHTNEHWEMIYNKIQHNQQKLMEEYAGITLCIPETNKWDYAIPENYTNFQNGFLWPDFESYHGAPIFDHPQFGRLYLRWEVPYYALENHETEKYLCFDRLGRKYTVIFTEAQTENGNPSYFRFLPKVKKYTGGRRHG